MCIYLAKLCGKSAVNEDPPVTKKDIFVEKLKIDINKWLKKHVDPVRKNYQKEKYHFTKSTGYKWIEQHANDYFQTFIEAQLIPSTRSYKPNAKQTLTAAKEIILFIKSQHPERSKVLSDEVRNARLQGYPYLSRYALKLQNSQSASIVTVLREPEMPTTFMRNGRILRTESINHSETHYSEIFFPKEEPDSQIRSSDFIKVES